MVRREWHGESLTIDSPILKAFFEDSFIPEPNSGCWIWMGPFFEQRGGYGCFTLKRAGIIVQRAHRVAWKLYRRPDLPKEVHILHHCDNPLCVNPDHLFEGDQAVNMRDKALKGRQRHGEDHPAYKHGRYIGDKQNPIYHKDKTP